MLVDERDRRYVEHWHLHKLKPVLAREMEVYAGFMEFTDYHTGRLIDALGQLQVLDDTLIFFIIGDNGASGEGTLQGTFNEMISLNGLSALETAAFLSVRLDRLGSPDSYNHYAVGWAHAMDTPYQWTKQVASHWAEPATAQSYIGQRASRPGARRVISSMMSSTWRRRFSTRHSSPSLTW
jgi:arylsulfatase A-like enzyme